MTDADGQSGRKFSGRWIVIILFSLALSMWGIVLLVGLNKRAERTGMGNGPQAVDTAANAETVRQWMGGLPGKWVKVSRIEGQGWVLYIPCYTANGTLTLRASADSLPGVSCEFCDSLDNYAVKSILRGRKDSVWDFRLEPPAGSLRLLPVDENLLQAFPEAPFKDRLLLWTRAMAGGRVDSMIFVPKTQETEFETLRAEDENPEGCGEATPD